MENSFYQRTAYALSDEPVPSCFLTLDDHLRAHLPATDAGPYQYCLVLAELICARMADVEMYAFLMADARKRHSLAPEDVDHASDIKTASLTRSFLIGYLGAVRALLDAAALTLTTLYELPLSGGDCSFRNGDFWHQFVVSQPNTQRRYHAMRLHFNEMLQWCDETAARIPPISLLQHHYGQFARRETLLQVLDERNIDVERLAADAIGHNWIDPLDLQQRWKPHLLALCEKLCQDIATQV